MSPGDLLQSWKRPAPSAGCRQQTMSRPGRSTDAAEAERWQHSFPASARPKSKRSELDGKDLVFGQSSIADGHGSLDDMLEAAWSHGAPDAIVVRD